MHIFLNRIDAQHLIAPRMSGCRHILFNRRSELLWNCKAADKSSLVLKIRRRTVLLGSSGRQMGRLVAAEANQGYWLTRDLAGEIGL